MESRGSKIFYNSICYIIIKQRYMVLTRQEKEQHILVLYNQGHNTRVIAQKTHTSFRDIGAILKKKAKEKEIGEHQAEQLSTSTQAYRLFSEGKPALQVAIDLQIKSDEAIQYQKEYWELNQLDSLTQLYKEEKGNIWPLVNLHKLLKASGKNLGQVINLLKIADNDLPGIERRYDALKRELNTLEVEKRNSAIIYQELSDKITSLHKRKDYLGSCCQIEEYRMRQLYKKNSNLMEFVQFFEYNNETYITIRKTVEEKVHSILSNGKMLLKLALLSLVESMRSNPDKFRSLLYPDVSSLTTEYSGQYYGYYMYEHKPYSSYNHDGEASVAKILEEEAGKLYNKLAKEMVDEIINDYASSIASSSLPDEKQEVTPVFPKQTLDNQKESKENGTAIKS